MTSVDTKRRTLRVLFPGNPREGKGYASTLAAVERLAADSTLRVTVRYYPQPGDPHAAEVERLSARAEFVGGNLDNEQFLSLFRRSDVSVLPYEPSSFANRTSGLLIDSIYHGVPVVAVRGTWLGAFVDRHRCGIGIDDATPEQIEQAVHLIAADYDAFVRRARSAAQAYFSENSWRQLAESVLEEPAPAAASPEPAQNGHAQPPKPAASVPPDASAPRTSSPPQAPRLAARPPRPTPERLPSASYAWDTTAPIALPPNASLYDRIYVWARSRSVVGFRAGQVAAWALRKARRYPVAAVACVVLLAALVGIGFIPGLGSLRVLPWIGAGLLFVFGLSILTLGHAMFLVKVARHEAEQRDLALRRTLEGMRSEQRERATTQAGDTMALRADVAALRNDDRVTAALRGDLDALRAEQRTAIDDLSAAARDLDERIAKAQLAAEERVEEGFRRIAGVSGDVQAVRGELAGARLELAGELETLRGLAIDELRSAAHSRGLLLDMISTLRKLRPLWESGHTDASVQVDEREHGHALLISLLVREAFERPGVLAGRSLVEIGTTRERDPYQSSTEKLAILSGLMGMRFTSVDMDAENTRNAEQLVRDLIPDANLVTAKGEDYLVRMEDKIDYLYLDAFDFEHAHHSPERRARYQEVLHTDISNEEAWKMHLVCAAAAVQVLSDDGIVVVDDTWKDEEGQFAGKGKLAVPLLESSGFDVVASTPRAVALRRPPRSDG